MNFTHYAALIIYLSMSCIEAVEVTQEQQIIYPQNPHLVQKVGNVFDDPQMREQFILSMKKASRFVRIAAYGCGIAGLGCLAILIRAESVKRKVVSLTASILLSAVAIFLDKVSTVQQQIALSQKTAIITEMSADAITKVKLVGVLDGVHIFSTADCPPCKLLHNAVPQIVKKFPTLTVLEYEINEQNDIGTQTIIQRMGINVISTPLTVVVKDGMISCIIVGYLNLDDYVQRLDALEA